MRGRRQWSSRFRLFACVVVAVAAADPISAALKELANDSFGPMSTVTCQVGFFEGESAAVKLSAEPGDYPYQVNKVRMMICPEFTSGFVILRLYEDNSGTMVPGALIWEDIVQVTGSNDSLNEVDLSLQNIIVSAGSVRVELEWFQDGPPGVANDDDGFVGNCNFIYADPPGVWYYAYQLGVIGDWIVRMEIETNVEDPIFADGFESGDTSGWTAALP